MRARALLVFAVVACNHEPTSAPDARSPVASAASSSSAVSSPPPAPADVTIVNVGAGRFEIRNASSGTSRLRTAASIERKTDAGWQPLTLDLGTGYRLVEECPRREGQLDTCVDVGAGATLVPVRWSGMGCSAQCNMTCRANPFEGPGTFRLVLHSCDGREIDGAPFDLPDAASETALDRWALAQGDASASAMRLDVGPGFDASKTGADRVAGFAVRAGTEHALDSGAIDALHSILRNEHGFDDQIAKRCSVAHLVGVRLTHTLATSGAPETESVDVAVDFACDKFFAAFGDPHHRVVLASHFDPSRAAFVAWAKQAMPGDAEIAKLE